MNELSIEELLENIVLEDNRYNVDAYHFVREGLDFTVKSLRSPRHVNGGELLNGIREYALEEYGPMAKRVLAEWGITCCEDIGCIVFNLVNVGLLGKTEDDSLEDFKKGYDFNDAFLQPYRPVKTH
jgi:uncharacterized repeat protein (TIGR04138 family)